MPLPKDPVKREEWLERQRDTHIGVKFSPEHIEKIRQANIGRKHTPESKAKMSKTRKGRKPSQLARRRVVEANQNREWTPEMRKKLSDRKKGWEPTQEMRQKIGDSHRGKKLSSTHIEKVRISSTGRRHTLETKEKLRIINLGRKMPREAVEKNKRFFTGRIYTPEKYIRMFNIWYGNVTYINEVPYCDLWTEELRERCRAYFGWQDPLSGTPQNGKRLHVHHVLWNKKTCCDNSRRYLVPLDLSNHMRMKGNKTKTRKDWMDELSAMIEGYYQGKCFWTKEEWAIMQDAPHIPLENRYNPAWWPA